jgi:hypothetical protein
MDAKRLRELEKELKKLITLSEQDQDEQAERPIVSGSGNVIRRRKGHQDRRISA